MEQPQEMQSNQQDSEQQAPPNQQDGEQQAQSNQQDGEQQAPPKETVFDWAESLAFAVNALLVLLVFCGSFSTIFGISMNDTLVEGDRVFVRSLFYTPQRGDIVTTDVLIDYGRPLVKRVIGLGGDVIEIDAQTGTVTVNGEVLNEPYARGVTLPENGASYPFTVPEGQVFLMGDNREHSLDSRSADVGCVDVRDLQGKLELRLAPLSRMGWVS